MTPLRLRNGNTIYTVGLKVKMVLDQDNWFKAVQLDKNENIVENLVNPYILIDKKEHNNQTSKDAFWELSPKDCEYIVIQSWTDRFMRLVFKEELRDFFDGSGYSIYYRFMFLNYTFFYKVWGIMKFYPTYKHLKAAYDHDPELFKANLRVLAKKEEHGEKLVRQFTEAFDKYELQFNDDGTRRIGQKVSKRTLDMQPQPTAMKKNRTSRG